MLGSCLDEFANNVYRFITKKDKLSNTLIVKKHTENLRDNGEFSFPKLLITWHGHLDLVTNFKQQSVLKFIGKEHEDLIKESKYWSISISHIKDEKDRIHLFIERPLAISQSLLQGLKNISLLSYRITEVNYNVHCYPLCEQSNDLTSLRLKYLKRTVCNLCSITVEQYKSPTIFVTSKSSSECPQGCKLFMCGTVLNSKTNAKESTIKAEEYIKIRQNEMTLIAQHKYGVRVSADSKWREFIANLGESAVVFELLQIKPSSAVKINFDCASSGSSKGAAFILYNCARLETIIRTYDDKVAEGVYPPLPPMESVDLSLLSQEEEWTMIFNYIMGLPCLINNCVELTDESCEFRPHHICSFLSSMVRIFSQYYRRVRILTEPRKHLLPVIYARMHMLKILNETLKLCLNILSIKSVSQM